MNLVTFKGIYILLIRTAPPPCTFKIVAFMCTSISFIETTFGIISQAIKLLPQVRNLHLVWRLCPYLEYGGWGQRSCLLIKCFCHVHTLRGVPSCCYLRQAPNLFPTCVIITLLNADQKERRIGVEICSPRDQVIRISTILQLYPLGLTSSDAARSRHAGLQEVFQLYLSLKLYHHVR